MGNDRTFTTENFSTVFPSKTLVSIFIDILMLILT